MTLFERLGRHSAAARCALAAARQVRIHEAAFFPAREALCLAMRNCSLRPDGFPFQGASTHLPATLALAPQLPAGGGGAARPGAAAGACGRSGAAVGQRVWLHDGGGAVRGKCKLFEPLKAV